eukprot:gnl/Dysnectes_brevis/3563_a4530_781.p1 GENE.gnl/Dysnectes_brevis/3563_a4530_781~~gnl/Dysnectes_brevis/3563_a4530_781.p1  ORF type:complete len:307 (+),score=86.80 gnl/Dysnectes_brevis/3563_a4530_781:180-1100(+)
MSGKSRGLPLDIQTLRERFHISDPSGKFLVSPPPGYNHMKKSEQFASYSIFWLSDDETKFKCMIPTCGAVVTKQGKSTANLIRHLKKHRQELTDYRFPDAGTIRAKRMLKSFPGVHNALANFFITARVNLGCIEDDSLAKFINLLMSVPRGTHVEMPSLRVFQALMDQLKQEEDVKTKMSPSPLDSTVQLPAQPPQSPAPPYPTHAHGDTLPLLGGPALTHMPAPAPAPAPAPMVHGQGILVSPVHPILQAAVLPAIARPPMPAPMLSPSSAPMPVLQLPRDLYTSMQFQGAVFPPPPSSSEPSVV